MHCCLRVPLIAAIIFLIGCSSENKEEKSFMDKTTSSVDENINYNISVLLDLSDRIDTVKYPNESMEYYERDIAHLVSVTEAFQSIVLHKKARLINDEIAVYFDPVPKNAKMNEYASTLKQNFNRENASKEKILGLTDKFRKATSHIYKNAIKDGKYIGSDTWGFMKEKAEELCIEKDKKNILIILTDGYPYHEHVKRTENGNRFSFITPEKIRYLKLDQADWKQKIETNDIGFISASTDFSKLDILVVGLNPSKNNPYEMDVLKALWSKWFEEMGVKRYKLYESDLPSNLDERIKDFILES